MLIFADLSILLYIESHTMPNTASSTSFTTHDLPKRIKREYLGTIDFLRAFAALSVCMFHYSDTSLVKFNSSTLASGFSWGYLGVEIFFVISGFVIPYSMLGTDHKPTKLGAFFLKRVIRICPSVYVTLALTIVYLIGTSIIHHNPELSQTITLKRLISNILFIVPFTNETWLNGVLWTLALEFQFYLIIGLIFNLLFTKVKIWRFSLIGLALSIPYALPFEQYFKFNTLFMMGGVTLLYYNRQIERKIYLLLLLLFTGVCIYTLSTIVALFGLATALIIAFAKVNHPTMKFLGNISFSLYLTHILSGAATEYILSRFYHPTGEIGNILGIILCFGAAIVIAAIYYTLIEKPLTKKIKQILFPSII